MLSVETKPEMSTVDLMLSLVDRAKFENTLMRLASESFNSKVDLSWHLRQWATNKQHLFKLLGNKLKVEKEVECALTKSAIMEAYREFSREVLEYNQKYVIAANFLMGLEVDEIANNILSSSHSYFGVDFKPGAKISRILAKLVHKDYVHDIQTKYSMFLQKLKAKGKAVVSIDPVDYITMSENKSGWRSCHALDGEYRTGTLAYMVDRPTMIAYVKTSEDVFIGDDCLPFSNKTWRQVVVTNPESGFSIQGRQYPANMINNETAITNLMIECFSAAKNTEYTFTTKSCGALDRVIHDADYDNERLWYNDFSAGAFDRGNLVHAKSIDAEEILEDEDGSYQVYIGSDVRCVHTMQWLQDSGYLSYDNYYDGNHDDDDWEDDYDNDDDSSNDNDW